MLRETLILLKQQVQFLKPLCQVQCAWQHQHQFECDQQEAGDGHSDAGPSQCVQPCLFDFVIKPDRRDGHHLVVRL